MRVTFTTGLSPNFQAVSTSLHDNLTARLEDSGNLGDPEPYPFLKSPACRKHLAEDSYPLDFTVLGFAFKATPDPAGQYPLRRLQACTANQACISAGCDLSGSDLAQQSIFDFTAVSEITKITSYYCQTKSLSSDDAQRYGRRLVAFVISYIPVIQGAAEIDQLFAAPGSLFDQARQGQVNPPPPNQPTLLQAIDRRVADYNTRNQTYQIWPQVNDDGLKMIVGGGGNQVRRSIVNIAYNQFEGKSRTYINNLSLLTAVPSTSQIDNLFNGLYALTFQMPFIANPLTSTMELTMERSVTDTVGSVTIYQKSSMHSFKIPGITIAGVDLSGVYSYSSGEQISRQKQRSIAEGLKNTMKVTVPIGGYVVRGFPERQEFTVGTVVGLIYGNGEQPKFEISIPTSTPFLNVASAEDLAQAIVGFV
ncbi:hypothetical protein [Roseibium suaedae]|uniref:Uncharacterized protein n=1 Tax=Roseibium suaedae TaxID=735517 RepID=A0A1M7F6B4_9HYPH|nr:hypothetical protein [Roseibium suaedae]SHL99591.1 hypothetical protein SAMN05444272_1511 [Roseibium suaedae]